MDTVRYVAQHKFSSQHVLSWIKYWPVLHAFAIAIAYVTILIIFFSPTLFSDYLFGADGIIPADIEMEPWSNYIFSGFPLIADPIWSKFYPIRIFIYRVLGLDFNYLVVFGYFLMAYFTYGYIYSLTRLKSASFISGLLFCFSGYAMYELGHAINFIHTLCWFPLVLLAFEKLKKGYSFWGMLGVIWGSAMTILGGFPQISFALMLIFISYPFLLVHVQAEKKYKIAFMHLMFIGLGYLLVAPVIISTFVLSLHSDRAHMSWEAFCTYYVELKQLLLFNFPYLMGGYHSFYLKTPSFAEWAMVGNHGYMGFSSLILAGIGLYKCKHFMRSYANYWLFWGIISVIVALGPEIPFFYEFLYNIPIVNNFRAPERYLFLFSFSVSILAAIGVQSMLSGFVESTRQKKLIFRGALFFTAILVISVIAIYPHLAALSLQKNKFSLPPLYQNTAVLIPILWIVLSLASLYYWLRRPASLWRCALGLFILSSELLSTGYFSYWHPLHALWSKEELQNPPPYINELRDDLNKSQKRYMTMRISLGSWGKYLWGNMPMYYQIPSANGVLPLAILRHYTILQIAPNGTYMGIPESFKDNQAINITGIKYLVTTKSEPLNAVWFKDTARFKLSKEFDDILIYENLNALPRVWFTESVMTLSQEEIFQVITSGKFANGALFLPEKTALIEGKKNINLEADKTAKAAISESEGSKLVINTQAEKPQFLVLNDVYFPGWKAYIDGKKTEIFLTDYTYRGIVVPAGSHTIIYEFRPWFLYVGYAISAMALLSILLLVFKWSRLSKKYIN